jgi:pimeloyl-ACP methyl ester carboxylesterase
MVFSLVDCEHRLLRNGISAYVCGQGAPLVLLPGWPQTAEAYAPLIPTLSATYEVWAIDLPGIGASAAPPTGSGFDTDTISNLIADALKDASCGRYHLVGHDVGAWVAFALASQYPNAVRTLTVLDSAIPGLKSGPSPTYPLPHEANKKLWQFSFNRVPDLPEILTAGKERAFLDWFFNTKAKHPSRITEDVRARYAACYAAPGAMANGFAYYRAFDESRDQNLRRREKGSRLAMPVLALGGDFAMADALRLSMEELGVSVEGGVVEDCGHYLMEEQPGEVCRRLLGFVQRHS